MCVQKIIWADDEIWTRDLFLTKEVLYPWATSAYTKRAGDEVRTRDIQLGRLTLYQLSYSRKKNKNMTVGRTGFEPVKVKPADLQSALVGRLSISPRNFKLLKYVLYFEPAEGFEPTTPRLQITCSGQLSYAGVACIIISGCKSITIFLTDKFFMTFFSSFFAILSQIIDYQYLIIIRFFA